MYDRGAGIDGCHNAERFDDLFPATSPSGWPPVEWIYVRLATALAWLSKSRMTLSQ
jgi:hypothetical protein